MVSPIHSKKLPFDLEARRTAPIWVTVRRRPDAGARDPGLWSCSGTFWGGRAVARMPFRLRVVIASVPEERTLKVTNWFTLDGKTSRQFYGVEAFSPQWWTLVANVAGVLAAYRQNVIMAPVLQLIQPRVEGGNLAF